MSETFNESGVSPSQFIIWTTTEQVVARNLFEDVWPAAACVLEAGLPVPFLAQPTAKHFQIQLRSLSQQPHSRLLNMKIILMNNITR
jgi:hypothetical protein